jgi:hypothetical protein
VRRVTKSHLNGDYCQRFDELLNRVKNKLWGSVVVMIVHSKIYCF